MGSPDNPFAGAQEEAMGVMMPIIDVLDRNKNKSLAGRVTDDREKMGKRHIRKHHALFMKNVPVMQDPTKEREKTAEALKGDTKLSVGAIAGINMGKLGERIKYSAEKGIGRFNIFKRSRLNDEGEALVKDKMRALLTAAEDQGVKHLVLGALGCGVFKNDPKQIAKLWKEVIDEEFDHTFETIQFAVLTKNEDKDPNFQAFKEAFEEKATES